MYPDPKLTPGLVDPKITQDNVLSTICKSGYTKTVRNVPESVKKAVFKAYGFKEGTYKPGDYEIDHFVSLGLGGLNGDISNPTANLWPEPYISANGEPGARMKDVVETRLHKMICDGRISLRDAQTVIRHDWYAIYLKIKAEK